MLMFAVRRILVSIPVLIGITLILFVMLNVVPGDPIALMMREHASPDVIEAQVARFEKRAPRFQGA